MSRYVRKEVTPRDLGAMQHQPPVCDFCAAHAPQWLYGARRMTTGAPIRCWRWCACPDCAAKVEAGRWDLIIRRIAETLARRNPTTPPMLLRQIVDYTLADFHQDVLKHGEQAP